MPTGRTSNNRTPGQQGAPRDGGDVSAFIWGKALRAGRLGTLGLLLSVLAAIAPLMVVAGLMPVAFGVMGVEGLPLIFVILGAALGLFSLGYAELSLHVHNSGAFYSYIARGLGGTVGSGAAMLALVAYSGMQTGLYGIFGFEVSSLADQYLHIGVVWWIPALAGVVAVGLLGWLKIDLNARLLGLLLLVEVLLVLGFDAAALTHPGPEGLSLHAFTPGSLSGAGVGTALCFCTAAFVGFEQAPVYAEETSRPHVVVGRVMFLAVGCVAVFFALSCWALTVAAGPSRIVAMAQRRSAGLTFQLVEGQLGGTFADVLRVLFMTAIFASALSFHNVVARYAFTMGREGLLPAFLGRTRSSSGAPALGSLLQTVISAVVVVAFAVGDDRPAGDPTTPVLYLFAWMGDTGALGIMVLMAVSCLAVIVFFVRRGAARAQRWRLAASAVAGVALCTVAGYTVKDFDVLLASEPGSPFGWVLPGTIGLAALVGLVQGAVLRLLRPELHARIGLGNQAFHAAHRTPEQAQPPRNGAVHRGQV